MKKDFCVVIPKGYRPSGQCANELARLADRILLLTSLTEERRKQKHWIPFGRTAGMAHFGSRWFSVFKAAQGSGLIEVNPRYSKGRFSKSVRLSDPYRTGEYELYALSRKPRNSARPKTGALDAKGQWLYQCLHDFYLDEIASSDPWESHAAARVHRRDLFATYCEFGRFHSNYTSLTKRLRYRLHTKAYDPLCQLDVANCQPLIIAGMAKKQSNAPDVKLWLSDCEAGRIYESILEVFQDGSVQGHRSGRLKPAKAFQTRDAIKEPFLIALFSSVPDMHTNAVYIAIKHRYPTIARYLEQIKSTYYQALAHQCQRLESEIIIRTVCPNLLPSGRPIFTVHDPLIVTSDLSEFAESEIRHAFRQRLSVEPMIKAEICDRLSQQTCTCMANGVHTQE